MLQKRKQQKNRAKTAQAPEETQEETTKKHAEHAERHAGFNHKETQRNTLELIKANVEKNLGTYHCLLLDSDGAWLDYCRNVDENTIVSLDTETSGLTFKDQVEGVAGSLKDR